MFDWRLYLDLADRLATQGGEAECRFAVSRAYYAAYCSAARWLAARETRFRMPAPGEDHKVVWEAFAHRGQRLSRKIADDGKNLRGQRNEADYRDEIGQPDKTAAAAVVRARNLLRLLEELGKNEPPRG